MSSENDNQGLPLSGLCKKSGKREIGLASFVVLVACIVNAFYFTDTPEEIEAKAQLLGMIANPLILLTTACLGIHIWHTNTLAKEAAQTERERIKKVSEPRKRRKTDSEEVVSDGEAV
jgi:hypothetical protein